MEDRFYMEIFFSSDMKKDPLTMFFNRRHTCGKVLDMVIFWLWQSWTYSMILRFVKNGKSFVKTTYLTHEYPPIKFFLSKKVQKLSSQSYKVETDLPHFLSIILHWNTFENLWQSQDYMSIANSNSQAWFFYSQKSITRV